MVRITGVRELDNCLDGAPVKEYELDTKLTRGLMNVLAADSKLQFFPHFPKPYFRVDRRDAWVIQGIIGSRTLRITFSPNHAQQAEEFLRCLIES